MYKEYHIHIRDQRSIEISNHLRILRASGDARTRNNLIYINRCPITDAKDFYSPFIYFRYNVLLINYQNAYCNFGMYLISIGRDTMCRNL